MTKETETPLHQLQWFQIALRTYFWAGFLFACVFATSLLCLAATKYYHDQAVLRHNEMQRDFRSYYSELAKARETVREVGKIWYSVDEMRKKIEETNK
jgi:hypothetical protein